MTKRILSFIIAIGLMVLLLVIVMAFSLSSNNGSLQPSAGRPAAQSTKVFLPLINRDSGVSPQEESPELPEGWLLFTNNKFGYSVGYPPTHEPQVFGPIPEIRLLNSMSILPVGYEGGGIDTINITVFEDSDAGLRSSAIQSPFTEWLVRRENYQRNKANEISGGSVAQEKSELTYITNIEHTEFNGHPVVNYTEKSGGSFELIKYYYAIKVNGLIYTIEFPLQEGQAAEEASLYQLFQQMLSTLTFSTPEFQ